MPEKDREELDLEQEDEETGLFDYLNVIFDHLIVLAKRKKLILTITLPVVIISIIICVRSSVSFYEAETSLFIAKQKQSRTVSQVMNQLGIFSSGNSSEVYNNDKLFVEIIKSRTFADAIVQKFNLRPADESERNNPRKLFLRKIKIVPDFTDPEQSKSNKNYDSPLMRIKARDPSPVKAAELANGIVEELNNFVNNIAVSEASQRRLFLEKHLKEASDSLIKAEEAYKAFQEETGIIEVNSQTSMVIEKIASLTAQITLNEINLKVMESYSTTANPEVQKIKDTIAALKSELAKLETKRTNADEAPVTTADLPELELEYKRLFRQLKYNEALYEIMVKQYEAAKLEEAKNATLIQVIDKAVPPKKIKKTRTWGGTNALLASMLAFVFSCSLAFAMEYFRQVPTDLHAKFKDFKRHLSFK